MKRRSRTTPARRPPKAVRALAIEGLPRLFTTEEVAAHLGCSPQHVCALIRDELLGAKNIGAAGARPQWRIPEHELRAFLEPRGETDETDETEETDERDTSRA